MVVRENATEIILRNAANQEVSVAVQNVAKRTSVGSLMPAGLIDSLLPDERLDLIKFLSQLGKPGAFDAAKGGVARTWDFYQVTSRNQNVGIDRVVRGDTTLAEWTPVLSFVSGVLPKEAIAAIFPQQQMNTRGLYAATRFQSARGGAVTLALAGTVKLAWLNGQPVKPAELFTVQAAAGVNTLVLLLDETKLPDLLKVGSADVSFVTN